MDPPVLLNECHIFILAQHEAFLKWRGPYYYCGRQMFARSEQTLTDAGRSRLNSFARWRVDFGHGWTKYFTR